MFHCHIFACAVDFLLKVLVRWAIIGKNRLNLLELQSRFGDKQLKFQVVMCPQ